MEIVKTQKFKFALIILSLSHVAIQADLYTKFVNFSDPQKKLANAGFYPELYTPQTNYKQYQLDLLNLYKANKNLVKGYFFQLIEGFIALNPCSADYEICTKEEDGTKLEDNPVIKKAQEVIIAWEFPQFLYSCSEEFMLKGVCGTVFEVHRPFDPIVLSSEPQKYQEVLKKLKFSTFSTDNLCSGKYEVKFLLFFYSQLWIVAKTRNGQFIQFIKPFFIQTPECTCPEVLKLGFACA